MEIKRSNTINLCLDEEYAQLGIERWITFDLESDGQRILIVGPSGSGKTVFASVILAKIGLHIPSATIWLIDYKGIDFQWCSECKNYYAVDKAIDGVNAFFTMFENRLYRRIPCDNIQVLFIDELSSLILSLPKKEQEELKSKIARILNLSRALKIIFITAVQRNSAELYVNGARDNYNIKFLMGANSRESVNMTMGEFKENIVPCRTGVGYCTINDMNLKKVRVVMPRDFEKLHNVIKDAVNR